MEASSGKIKVLFLCTGNSCRSQMAEGWTRRLKGAVIEPYSAGIEPHGLNARAVEVMAEAGVDISGHRSKHVDELKNIPFDYIVTVCDHANESCPVFSGKHQRVHISFDDPPGLAANAHTEEEALQHYRRVRDEIRAFVEKLPGALSRGSIMPKISPFLWFDTQAEEAAHFYVSIFNNSKVVNVTRYGEAGPGPKGSVMTVEFELDGQAFTALNGGPHFKFTEAISFSVDCRTQEEVDKYWQKLSEGGEEGPCGWLKDKYGLSWQINPTILGEMLNDPDPQKAKRVMEAMLKMKKIDIAGLQRAYDLR
jgi:thioredoxin type arsenate reductase